MTTLIAPAHIIDHRFRPLVLDLEKLEERLGLSAEEHRKIGRDGILGSAVGGRNVGEIKRAPVRNPRREQTAFEIFRRDWFIRDRMAGNSGER